MDNSDLIDGELTFNCSFEMSLDVIYITSLNFFRENKDKAFHMKYPTRIRMSALSHHIKYGGFESGQLTETGLLDVVGRDIRRQLISLAAMSREYAMREFIESLKTICPEFIGFLEAKEKQAELEAQKKREAEEEERLELLYRRKKEDEEKAMLLALDMENERRVEQEKKLRSIINRQTLPQFQEYAAQQHPDDSKLQERLIVQLQHHHFHQYMLAVYERSETRRTQCDSLRDGVCERTMLCGDDMVDSNGVCESERIVNEPCQDNGATGDDTRAHRTHGSSLVANGDIVGSEGATGLGACYSQSMVEMWCQASVDEFKTGFKEEPDSVMKIGSGEIVTIKVPGTTGTGPGEYLVWQFATDEHDIGFGLSVVTLGSDGAVLGDSRELVPILRRDSHKQVYCGRLRLLKNNDVDDDRADRLCFLLRFDNSYSLWRYKWLYYRVCYSD